MSFLGCIFEALWTPLWLVFVSSSLAVVVYLTLKVIPLLKMLYGRREENDLKRLQKQIACAQGITELEARLQEDPLEEAAVTRITSLSLNDLVNELKTEKITPSTALKAFQTKTLAIHKEKNCLVEVIKEAEEWAEAIAKTPKDGLLWGVPISLKDDFVIKGYDSSFGCIEFVGDPAKDDCLLLKVLKSHGAVPYVRTNVPQLTLSFEPGNPIFGRVQNAHKNGHGAGGSSSGEGALVGAGGSVLGIGSDIAGSIRIPSHFNGNAGFKPTVGRMSNYGISGGDEQDGVGYIYGPMTKYVEDIIIAMRAFWDGKSLSTVDPTSVPLRFNDDIFQSTRPLKIGYYVQETNHHPVFETCKRAVLDAKSILEKNGHEVVQWECPDLSEANKHMHRFMKAEGGVMLSPLLRFDLVDDTIYPLVGAMLTPFWWRWIQERFYRIFDPPRANELKGTLGIQKTIEYWYRSHELEMFAAKVTQSWAQSGLDVVICPPCSTVAPRFGNSENLLTWCLYSAVYNIVNFPCGIVPMTSVTSADIDSLKDFPVDTEINRSLKEEMAHCLGLPAGVMIVAPRFQDEYSLRVMSEIQKGKVN